MLITAVSALIRVVLERVIAARLAYTFAGFRFDSARGDTQYYQRVILDDSLTADGYYWDRYYSG